MSERMSEDMPERMSEDMRERMSDRMSGDMQRMADKMSEEIAVGCCLSQASLQTAATRRRRR